MERHTDDYFEPEAPKPTYDDDAFALTERVPRVVIECSKEHPVPRVHQILG